jgi:hypothetical protein
VISGEPGIDTRVRGDDLIVAQPITTRKIREPILMAGNDDLGGFVARRTAPTAWRHVWIRRSAPKRQLVLTVLWRKVSREISAPAAPRTDATR